MSYLGRGLDKISNIEILDNITFDGSSSYSITKSSVAFVPNSAQSLLISIDGVVQATNFSVSTSTIDFGVAVPSTSTCNFFLHYGTGVLFTPADGTVTASKLASSSITGQTAETSANDSDSILIYDDSATSLKKMTRSNFLTGVGGTNTPYFEARRSGTQTITNDTDTKIACNVETWDTAGDYDNATNYRFTPQTAGKYFIYGQAVMNAPVQQLKRFSLFIRKNGNDVKYMSNYFTNNEAYINNIYLSTIIDFNGSSDYVELWCKLEYASSGTLTIDGGTPGPTFGGYKIIE